MCSGSEAGSCLRPMNFVYHSTLGLRVIKKGEVKVPRATLMRWGWCEREIFIDNLLVRVHLLIEMRRPALRQGSLNALFQVVLYLPS